MKANGITCKSYTETFPDLKIILACGFEDAREMDTSSIEVTTDAGSVCEIFTGYTRIKTAVDELTGDSVIELKALGDTGEMLSGFGKSLVSVSQSANDAQKAADEAKTLAKQAGTDPQVAVVARLTAQSIDFAEVSATDVVGIPDYIPEWSTLIGQKLKQNSPCRYNGIIYRASQDVTVQEIYPPDVAGESLYYPITVAPDGIIVYRECHGEYDMVRGGESRHYPDAEGPVYRAKVDTASSPDAYPDDWELV